jgi:hypothetical protein
MVHFATAMVIDIGGDGPHAVRRGSCIELVSIRLAAGQTISIIKTRVGDAFSVDRALYAASPHPPGVLVLAADSTRAPHLP